MTCRWCDSTDHTDEQCPRVAGFTYHPNGVMASVGFLTVDTSGAEVVTFLDSIEPSMLDSAAAEVIGIEGETYGECVLAVLRKWASVL